MNNRHSSPSPKETAGQESSSRPAQSAAPGQIGVYDRPERTGPPVGLIIGALIVLGLLLLGVVLFLLLL